MSGSLFRRQLRRRTKPAESRSIGRELAVLRKFAEVYCRAHHGVNRGQLCAGCGALVEYAKARLMHCPYDPKPKCKHCPTHCYAPAMRQRVREIMKFSGMYFVRRGRLDWLVKYFLM